MAAKRPSSPWLWPIVVKMKRGQLRWSSRYETSFRSQLRCSPEALCWGHSQLYCSVGRLTSFENRTWKVMGNHNSQSPVFAASWIYAYTGNIQTDLHLRLCNHYSPCSMKLCDFPNRQITLTTSSTCLNDRQIALVVKQSNNVEAMLDSLKRIVQLVAFNHRQQLVAGCSTWRRKLNTFSFFWLVERTTIRSTAKIATILKERSTISKRVVQVAAFECC